MTRKNHALKVHEKKLQQQLQQKKETGKAEYEVDDESVRVITRGANKARKSVTLCLSVTVTMCGTVCCFLKIFQEYSEQRIDKNRDELQVNNLKVQRVLSSHKVSHYNV